MKKVPSLEQIMKAIEDAKPRIRELEDQMELQQRVDIETLKMRFTI